MGKSAGVRKHEVSFCADVKSWADALFAQHPEWPFAEAHIEEYSVGSQKLQDLRILARGRKSPILTGEAKMPGTPEGRTPYNPDLMQDAFQKADNIQADYFFTWNVNKFVLFDRSLYKRPMIQRRVREWDLGLGLSNSADCVRPEVQAYIRDSFLPQFFEEFAQIVGGAVIEWGMPPDEVFLRSLEDHLGWPVTGTRDYLAVRFEEDKSFASRLQSWMTSEMQWTLDLDDLESRRDAFERAARMLCYVFSNRAIFYKAVQAHNPGWLEALAMPVRVVAPEAVYGHFRRAFAAAVEATGDYEPVFYPDINDWAGSLIFASPFACQGWRGFFVNLEQYDFRKIPFDIVGGIFQKLISPEERQKFGQFFTHQDIVDVINAFCIRRAGDVVLDPACGSGSFLVRAYHRKAWLGEQRRGGRRNQDHGKFHHELLQELYGCDIALFPAHLATLNLAARQISDEDNFPLVRRGNFFEVVEHPERFCTVPGIRDSSNGKRPPFPVPMGTVDAVVGNPPYVRQELIPKRSELKKARDESKGSFESRKKNTKEFFLELLAGMWPGLKLSGRSDLHCYFWPASARFLKEGGYFGFLTSSSWLDVEYGFALQGWILQNFKIIAVLESLDEPWFPDARIKTAVAILQRCDDEESRGANVVRFVRLQRPLAEILGERPHGDETSRQDAADGLRKFIEKTAQHQDAKLRIISVQQSRLWQEGVQAGRLLAKSDLAAVNTTNDDDDTEEGEEQESTVENVASKHTLQELAASTEKYAAGKWGRFLRAPDVYFRIMQDYGSRFVKLGEIAEVRRGITSGCDAFFMPHDVTDGELEKVAAGLPWNDIGLMTPCKLSEVKEGRVRIIRAGDKTLHAIETEYLRPELHSLMQVDRPIVRVADTDRVVLWVDKELKELSGTYVAKYVRWGAKQTFASKKSKAVPVPERSTVASRPLWYDLTGAPMGVAFWPKAQKYRHIVPFNPEGLCCNCNLYTLVPTLTERHEAVALVAILNSTIMSLLKHFYGRYVGAEGTLKTEIVDVVLMEVPNPRGIAKDLAGKLEKSLNAMSQRQVTHLVDRKLLDCHTESHLRELLQKPPVPPRELEQADRRELDDCVLELIGVGDSAARQRLLDELYAETIAYYRYQRTQDIQSMENRAGSRRRITAEDIAGSIWDSLADNEKGPELREWLNSLAGKRQTVHILDGKARATGAGHMFTPNGVDFAQGKSVHHETYANAPQAKLVEVLANLEMRGDLEVPADGPACQEWIEKIRVRLSEARERFELLAGTRTGVEPLRSGATGLLMQWFLHGRR